MRKVAVILSGCGYQDGTEITEAVSTLVALGQYRASYQCFAPDKNFESSDHLHNEKDDERNTLVESARITRGQITELSLLQPQEFDALIFPGGFGAAMHLSDWKDRGSQCKVLPDIVRVITEFHDQSKPIGAMCISPVLVAKILGDHEVTLTIGNDPETAAEMEKLGVVHEDCEVDDYITDRANKVVTSPAYMYDKASPAEVFKGVSGLVKEVVEMA